MKKGQHEQTHWTEKQLRNDIAELENLLNTTAKPSAPETVLAIEILTQQLKERKELLRRLTDMQPLPELGE